MSDLKRHRKWYNDSFLPAITKALQQGKITQKTFDKLNKNVEKYRFDYK